MTLLYLALVLPLDEILAPLVLGEELQLLGIDGTTSLLPDQVHRVLVLHPQLNQCCCYQHRSPAKSSDAVNSYACFGISFELGVDQREPPLNYLLSGRRPIREGEFRYSHTWTKTWSGLIDNFIKLCVCYMNHNHRISSIKYCSAIISYKYTKLNNWWLKETSVPNSS